jgi:AcrR family transcriptional regulator
MARGAAGHKKPRRGVRPLTQKEIVQAAALKRFRTESGMTQEQLAERLDVSQGTLSEWEGARKPIPPERFDDLRRIAADFAQRVESLAEGERSEQAAGPAGPDPVVRANVPPEPPPDFGPGGSLPPGGIGEIPLPELTPSDVQRALAKGPEVVYQLVSYGLSTFVDDGAGAILSGRAEMLSISLVQAGDVSPAIARIVQLLQTGPVLACLAMHISVMVEIAMYLRAQAQAQAPAAPAPAQAEPSLDDYAAAAAAA